MVNGINTPNVNYINQYNQTKTQDVATPPQTQTNQT